MHAWFFEDLIPDSIKDALNIQGIPAYGTMIFLAIVVAAVYLIFKIDQTRGIAFAIPLV